MIMDSYHIIICLTLVRKISNENVFCLVLRLIDLSMIGNYIWLGVRLMQVCLQVHLKCLLHVLKTFTNIEGVVW